MGSARNTSNRKLLPQLRSRTTRSSKGRLLSSTDPAISTALLTTQLRALGLYAADTIGDGNCLFRALADQLYGSPHRHLDLRTHICDWIAKHRDRYEPFVEDDRGLEVHLRCMRENGTYGGHMELSAFAHWAQRDVKVIQPGLVYVIEWSAFAVSPAPAQDDDQDGMQDELGQDDRESRRRRRERVRGKGSRKSAPPLPDPEEEEQQGEGDTIYVAYHDWEHFSSIRNLRGPHVGLPTVREVPPPSPPSLPTVTPPSPSKTPAKKGGKKKKVTLKLGSDETSTPALAPREIDPTTVPLPSSRAASPFPPAAAPLPPPGTTGHPLRSSFLPSSPPLPLRPVTRSPKRSFESDDSDAASSSAGSKRTRHSKPLHSTLSLSSDNTHDSSSDKKSNKNDHMDVDADTPSLSSHGSSSSPSSSSLSSPTSSPSASEASSSAASSPEPEPEPEPIPAPKPKSKLTPKSKPTPTPAPPEPPTPRLTRRQRKALGLPKPRPAVAVAVAAAHSPPVTRAQVRSGNGKLVIPGGKFKRSGGVRIVSPDGDGDGEGVDDEDGGEGEGGGGEGGDGGGEGEWMRNGTGRVDVRGFRELKI